jgi:hypothetical protein
MADVFCLCVWTMNPLEIVLRMGTGWGIIMEGESNQGTL